MKYKVFEVSLCDICEYNTILFICQKDLYGSLRVFAKSCKVAVSLTMTHKGSRSSVILTSSNTAHMSALTWLWAALGWKLDGLMLRLPSILLYWSAITVASSSPEHKHRKLSVIFLTFQTQTAELYSPSPSVPMFSATTLLNKSLSCAILWYRGSTWQ